MEVRQFDIVGPWISQFSSQYLIIIKVLFHELFIRHQSMYNIWTQNHLKFQ